MQTPDLSKKIIKKPSTSCVKSRGLLWPWQASITPTSGKLRRECLDHINILSENHLRSVLTEYIDEHYNVARTHMSLNKDSPVPRPVQAEGRIASKPILGGLHHIYTRVA